MVFAGLGFVFETWGISLDLREMEDVALFSFDGVVLLMVCWSEAVL